MIRLWLKEFFFLIDGSGTHRHIVKGLSCWWIQDCWSTGQRWLSNQASKMTNWAGSRFSNHQQQSFHWCCFDWSSPRTLNNFHTCQFKKIRVNKYISIIKNIFSHLNKGLNELTSCTTQPPSPTCVECWKTGNSANLEAPNLQKIENKTQKYNGMQSKWISGRVQRTQKSTKSRHSRQWRDFMIEKNCFLEPN